MTDPAANPLAPPSADGQSGAVLRLLDRPVVDADLAAAAREAATPVNVRSARTIGVLIFRLGDEILALPAASLRRVTPHARPSAIPHRRSGTLRGICNIRGELVLCADLRRLLGLSAADADDREHHADADPRRMIVIGPADASWVFEVEALVGIERIDPSTLRSPPVTVEYALADFVTGLADLDVGCVTILDDKRVLKGLEAGLT
jgi:chemotaxis-related protein WspD